ncbi:baculoviral IAP repeat-containing protein 7-like isoform X2 [Centruroides vittatus]
MQDQGLTQYKSVEEKPKLLTDSHFHPIPPPPSSLETDGSHVREERTRLMTFSSWPHEDVIASHKLAKAGFYYNGNGDEVQCFSCGGKIKGWQPGDVAVRKHRELYPKCNFIAEIFNKAFKKPNLGSNGITTVPENNLTPSDLSSSNSRTLQNGQTHHNSDQNASTSAINQISQNRNLEDTSRIPDFEKLKSERERLKTFETWPLTSPKPCDLAREGFFYLLQQDKVQCVFCRGVVSHWERNDDPLREHARHFPFCPFVMNRNVGNIPINSPEPSHSVIKGAGRDECGSLIWKNSGPENGYKSIRKANKLENFGVKLHHGPRHPAQASKDARLRSFVTWPATAVLRPAELVDAGFFYIGIKDYTRCFYCDGGLCNWEKGDDPWVEHARWFQNCAYVRLNKGDDFVEACLNNPSRKSNGEVNMESTSNEVLHVSEFSLTVEHQVDEYMKSDIVKKAIEPGIFPSHVIRDVLLRRVQNGDGNFENADELCEAVLNLQQEMENNESNESTNIDEEPMEVKEEMNVTVRTSTSPSDVQPPSFPVSGQSASGSASIDDLLKEQRLCKICMDKEIGVLFLPCGHLVACVQCAPAMSDCPFCRKPIKGTVRAFLT